MWNRFAVNGANLQDVTIDSNIVIAFLGGEPSVIRALTNLRELGTPLILPTIVEAEILSFSLMTKAEREKTILFLEENFSSVAFDRTTARLAGVIRSKTKIKLPDAIIAATSILMHSPLITKNIRDFKRVEGLQIIEL